MILRFLVPMVLALTTGGCAVITEMGNYLKEEYEAASRRDRQDVALAKLVAATRSHQTSSTNLITLQGYYGGRTDDGCHRVTIRNIQHKHTAQYRVCGDLVLGLNEPIPALPPAHEINPVRDSVSRAAWSSGAPVSAPSGAYMVEAVPVGPSDGQGCRTVEERVTFSNQTVDLRRRRICP